MANVNTYHKPSLGDCGHSFCISSDDAIFVIDTGRNGHGFEALRQSAEEMENPIPTVVLLTHSHIDHTGGLKELLNMKDSFQVDDVILDASILKASMIVDMDTEVNIHDLEISGRDEALNILYYLNIYYGKDSDEYKAAVKEIKNEYNFKFESKEITEQTGRIYDKFSESIAERDDVSDTKQKAEIKERIVALFNIIKTIKKDGNATLRAISYQETAGVDNLEIKGINIQAIKIPRTYAIEYYRRAFEEGNLLEKLGLENCYHLKTAEAEMHRKQVLEYLYNNSYRDNMDIDPSSVISKIEEKLAQKNANHDNVAYILTGDDNRSVIALGDMELLYDAIFIEMIREKKIRIGKAEVIESPHHSKRTSLSIPLIIALKEEAVKYGATPIFVESRGNGGNYKDREASHEKFKITGTAYVCPQGKDLKIEMIDNHLLVYCEVFRDYADKLELDGNKDELFIYNIGKKGVKGATVDELIEALEALHGYEIDYDYDFPVK